MKKLLTVLPILVLVFLAAYAERWLPTVNYPTEAPVVVDANQGGVGEYTGSQIKSPPTISQNSVKPPSATTPAAISPGPELSKQPSSATKQPSPVSLPVQSPPAATKDSAQEMLGYINSERTQAKLTPLTLAAKLSDGAYLKSKDMAVNGYFEHNSPTYGTPFAMMKSLGITYRTAAENIAYHQSVLSAHKAFMNSPGHRANILNPAFHKIGLGIYKSGSDIYVTQWFTD